MLEKKVFEWNFNGKKLIVEHGELAQQASSSILIRYENTVVLTAIVIGEKTTNTNFFPLTVIFQEKLYSVGKIPGGFFKREGKPSDYATLSARLIDRPIRPLFDENYRNEVQVINNVLSVGQDDVRVVALFASSLGLSISSMPFSGPVAGVIVAKIDDQLICNPSTTKLEHSQLEVFIAGTKDAINMVEASAKEVSEKEMLEAIAFGHQEIKKLISFQEEVIKSLKIKKQEPNIFTISNEIINDVKNNYEQDLIKAVKISDKIMRYDAIDKIKTNAILQYENKIYDSVEQKNQVLQQLNQAIENIIKAEVRRLITKDKIRLDQRKSDEIRKLSSKIDFLPVVHGSALFTRGETQVLSIVTLGALGEHQIIDGLTDEESKRFMHHYNFPQFSVGQTGRYGPPTRREVGHGTLGEKALLQVLPDENKFPYTIRIVSEVLASNGSTSQASICASSLALMAAGVPITCPVAGIAMGLIMEDDDYTILTDIQGMEDHLGDMDFKVAGTSKGICALQMDIKIKGISEKILTEALEQARVGRIKILENMNQVINEPRSDVAENAPKIFQTTIAIDKIRDIIGPGGKTITAIIEKSDNVKIDIEDDGRLIIYHKDRNAINKAWTLIKDIIEPFEIGTEINGKVMGLEKFGAFIRLKDGVDGLLHSSKITNLSAPLKIGDNIMVTIIGIDERNRVKLGLTNSNDKIKLDEKK